MNTPSFLLAFALAAAPALAAPAAPVQAAAAQATAKLAPGMPAPALSIEKWVKGSPVASFEKGKVYVVEFWATWCGPCIKQMPHVSALQRQYKDKGLTVIGVTSADANGNTLEKVEKMVADKGDGMGYTVAWDTERTTNKAYMEAAGERGIPCSFVVDGQGRIAYIGHPMLLDAVLAGVVAGSWDPEKDAAAAKAAMAGLDKVYSKMNDDAAAVAAIEAFEKEHPRFAFAVTELKFQALVGAGQLERAVEVGGPLVEHAIELRDAQTLNLVAWTIVDPEATYAVRNLDLALKAAEKGVEFTDSKDPAILDTLAWVWFWKGDAAKAIEVESKALPLAVGQYARYKADLEKSLEKFKAKAAN